MNKSADSAKPDVNIVLKVTEARAIVLPKPKAGSVHLKNVDFATGKMLIPGENDVPLSYWEEIKGNPAVKIFLACETIENKGSGKAKPILGSLDSMTVSKGIELVGKCEDVTQLKTWMRNSKKANVKKAIENQINLLIEMEDGAAD